MTASDNSLVAPLIERWAVQAKQLDQHRADGAAAAYRAAISDLVEHFAAHQADLIGRTEAARVVGCNPDSITRAIRRRRLKNHGSKHSPLVRRADVEKAVRGRGPRDRAEEPAKKEAEANQPVRCAADASLVLDAIASRSGALKSKRPRGRTRRPK